MQYNVLLLNLGNLHHKKIVFQIFDLDNVETGSSLVTTEQIDVSLVGINRKHSIVFILNATENGTNYGFCMNGWNITSNSLYLRKMLNFYIE